MISTMKTKTLRKEKEEIPTHTHRKILHVYGLEMLILQNVHINQSNLYIQYNPKVTSIPYRLKKKVILMFICNMKEPKHSKQS